MKWSIFIYAIDPGDRELFNKLISPGELDSLLVGVQKSYDVLERFFNVGLDESMDIFRYRRDFKNAVTQRTNPRVYVRVAGLEEKWYQEALSCLSMILIDSN